MLWSPTQQQQQQLALLQQLLVMLSTLKMPMRDSFEVSTFPGFLSSPHLHSVALGS